MTIIAPPHATSRSTARPDRYDDLRREELIGLLTSRDGEESGGIRLSYKGQAPPWQIVRKVKPRRQQIERRLSVGTEDEQSSNLIVEGENLQALVSLYKYRGQVDVILTDPPYNTGKDFRYNDRWDEDPNDPDLGALVSPDDGSRHAKWLRFMTPRLWMMKQMLRPAGVLAICIDHRELFRLGILLDGIFGETNRIGIINWQKSYAPRNDQKHISTATEYVLIYSKDLASAKTRLLPRTEGMDARYAMPDGDSNPWTAGDTTAPGAATHAGMVYAVQSPFTGVLHYPSEGRCWGSERRKIKAFLEMWGSQYVPRDIGDDNPPAFVINGAPTIADADFSPEHHVLRKARAEAERIRDKGPWPIAYWRDNGLGAFRLKKYLKDVRRGVVPTTYWSEDDYDTPLEIGATSWGHRESGHSQTGLDELTQLVGRGHGFDTVKPLRLFKKIIHLWCPPSGIVMDPFAGSGTTAHAALELNQESGSARRFILVEQGRPERGDAYARTLTAERVRRAISGERPSQKQKLEILAAPLPGGFRFTRLSKTVDAAAVLALEREEMIDLLLTTHWDQAERSSSYLRRLPAGTHAHLFAVSGRNEGYFLVWSGPDRPSLLDRTAFRAIVEEARAANLKPPYNVYARISTYSGPNIVFYQIPNRILEKLGFNEAIEPFSAQGTENGAAS
jgi:adenine-specific DNA-methyltransferase